MIRKYGDVIAGGFLIGLSTYIFIASFGIKMLTASRIGSAFVPQVTSVLLAIAGAFILINGIKKVKANDVKVEQGNDSKEKPIKIYSVIATLVSIFLYILLLEDIGFLIMTALYLFIQFYILASKSERNIPIFIVTAVVISGCIYFIFANVFQLMLPSGILG
jgi:flagellar biosynthesis component FlhA